MLYKFKTMFSQPKMCSEIPRPLTNSEDTEFNGQYHFHEWDQEVLLDENVDPRHVPHQRFYHPQSNGFSRRTSGSSSLIKVNTINRNKITRMSNSSNMSSTVKPKKNNNQSLINSHSRGSDTFVPRPGRSSEYNGLGLSLPSLAHSYSATENLCNTWKLPGEETILPIHSSGDKLTYFGEEIITESPKDNPSGILSGRMFPRRKTSSQNSILAIQGDDLRSSIEERGFHSSDNLDVRIPQDSLATIIPNGSYNAYGPSLVNQSVNKSMSTSSSIISRKSSIKTGTKKKKRTRHSSGHSVTFDLPVNCDNLGLSSKMPSEPLLDTLHLNNSSSEYDNEEAVSDSQTRFNSKAHKQKSNELKKILPKQKSLPFFHHNQLKLATNHDRPRQRPDCSAPDDTLDILQLHTNQRQYEQAIQQQLAFINDATDHHQGVTSQESQQGARSKQHPVGKDGIQIISESACDVYSNSLPEEKQFNDSSNELKQKNLLSSAMANSLPNSWAYDNIAGLFPHVTSLSNSIGWSSGDSTGGESSDQRTLDSGYWGRGFNDQANVAAARNMHVNINIPSSSASTTSNTQPNLRHAAEKSGARRKKSKKKHVHKYRQKVRGVKVVTQGTSFFLPYAYLEEGRMKLNIVRDDVLEENGCALSVRDVSELLHSQYAIITGGKSREGCPIITFPDTKNFHHLGDEEYRKLIIYLTSVPSLQDADLGFVLIIDRRTDKWSSVKTVLLKVSGFFPGLITVAYVLRPGGFLQKAISEVSSKIFREEFKFKVVVCNCVLDLHALIDRNQLTDTLEGCIPYNHENWIDQRVAVEKFSSDTQEISGALRGFTQALQETEFPNDVSSCEALLKSQTCEYAELKDDLHSASRNGEILLKDIKRPGEPLVMQMCPDKLISVTAVERLLIQLEETEKTFDDFWTRHALRLTQCLQLRNFESDFKELQPVLEKSVQELSQMTQLADTVEKLDELLVEAKKFNQDSTDTLKRAEDLRSMGSQLIENQHYAVDSIQPKCVEIIRMRESFLDLITRRMHTLHKCRDFQEKVDKINEWCANGVELLASHQMERIETPEQAEEALKELDDFSCSSEAAESNKEIKEMLEEATGSETKALVQQVMQRMEDVLLMCDKKKCSLKKIATRPPRPIHVVSPEPATPLPPLLPHTPPHSHPASPLHHQNSSGDLNKSPKLLRRISNLSKPEEDSDYPDCIPDPEMAKAKRGHILRELLETERVYVTELCSILKGYKDEMINPEFQPQIPINLYGKTDILFGNMEEIFRFHNDIFLRDLDNCINTPELIGLCFVQRKDTFHHLYSLYCQNKPQSEELRRQVGDNNLFFKECQRRLGHKLPLGAYLLKPVQRITKYQLLLKDLLKCVQGNQGRIELQEAVDTMLTVLKCLNDSMHQVAITGYPGNLGEGGRLLMQGAFGVWNDTKKGLRDLRLKPAQRHLFLYEKMLLFTKRAGKDTDRETYHFKNALQMSKVGLTENLKGNKGDLRKFEIWLQGRQQVYSILAPSSEVKDNWVKQIKTVLLNQFEFLKGENIKQYSSRIQKGSSLNGMRAPPLSPPAQHKSLRQTASWEVGAGSTSSSSSDSGKGTLTSNFNFESSRDSSVGRRSNGGGRTSSSGKSSMDGGDCPPPTEEEEESWSSEYSPSDEEDDQETFTEMPELASSRFLVLADYNAMGSSEVSLREGDNVDLIKVGCAGWWYVRVCGAPFEGWAPAAYLERVIKKRSSPSVSSQDSTSGCIRPATSRSSVTSISNKTEEVP